MLGVSYAALLAGVCVLAVLGVDQPTVYILLGGAAGAVVDHLAAWSALIAGALILASAVLGRAITFRNRTPEDKPAGDGRGRRRMGNARPAPAPDR